MEPAASAAARKTALTYPGENVETGRSSPAERKPHQDRAAAADPCSLQIDSIDLVLPEELWVKILVVFCLLGPI
jgi:hypothetical protein